MRVLMLRMLLWLANTLLSESVVVVSFGSRVIRRLATWADRVEIEYLLADVEAKIRRRP